ncbi:MAG: tetratricopeptide repeat protein [Candidatus Eisenbacteria sp.]|nr:tetratricopeptide repeat protein [Candidatus Eisenbacteria bacterium]
MKTSTTQAKDRESGIRTPPPIWQWGLLLLVLAVGLWLRLYDLSADPPLGMTWSHAPYTDGARIVDGARSKLLWGAWETDPAAPIFLYYPLSSVLAYLAFAGFGVGLWQANFTGVLPGIGILILVMWLGMRKDWWVAWMAGLISAVNFFLVAYNRMPMCESLMILVVLLVPFFLLRYPLRRWHLLSAGVALAAAAFFVKLHALVLLPVTVLWLVLFREEPGADRGWRNAGLFLCGLAAGAAIWILAILVPHPAVIRDFLDHNLLAHYAREGSADGGGVVGFLTDRLFALTGAGTNVRFFGRMPVVGLLAVFAAFSFASHWKSRRGRTYWIESFCALWFVGGVVALALLEYRPLRYHLQLIPAAALLSGLALRRLLAGVTGEESTRGRGHLARVFIFSVFIWFQALIEVPVYMARHQIGSQALLRAVGLDPRSVFTALSHLVNSPGLVLFVAAVASAVTAGIVCALSGRPVGRSAGMPVRAALAIVLMGIILAVNGSLQRDARAWERHSLRDVSEDLGEILGSGAFVVGTTATTLSLQNEMRTLPAYGRIAKQRDVERFRGYPITHLLLRDGALNEFLQSDFPGVSDSLVFLRRYVIGPTESSLYRLRGWAGVEPGANRYNPTSYERGLEQLGAGNWAEAEGELQAFLEAYPENAAATLALGVLLERLGQREAALEMMQRAALLAPEDLAVLSDMGAAYARAGRVAEAASVWRRVLALNPRDARAGMYLQALRRNLQNTGRDGGARP